MIRTIVKVEKNTLVINLPPEYVGKEIEVIAFLPEEAELKSLSEPTQKTFSAVTLDTRGYKFNRKEANER